MRLVAIRLVRRGLGSCARRLCCVLQAPRRLTIPHGLTATKALGAGPDRLAGQPALAPSAVGCTPLQRAPQRCKRPIACALWLLVLALLLPPTVCSAAYAVNPAASRDMRAAAQHAEARHPAADGERQQRLQSSPGGVSSLTQRALLQQQPLPTTAEVIPDVMATVQVRSG